MDEVEQLKRDARRCKKKIRVLVVDDHPFFRSGIVEWINRHPTLTCCGEADTVAAARSAAARLRPDIVLLDLRLPDGDGLELIRDLLEDCPDVRVIALSQYDEITYAHRALQAGARGYIMKSAATDAVLAAIEAVFHGEVYLSRAVAARLTHNLFPDPASIVSDLTRLSDRELEVFQMLGAGCRRRDLSGASEGEASRLRRQRAASGGNSLGRKGSAGHTVEAARAWR